MIWGAFLDRPADTIVSIGPAGVAMMGRLTESPHQLLHSASVIFSENDRYGWSFGASPR